MKASKVFIWIGMICGFYMIFPIIVGVLALKKLEEAQTPKDLQTLGILTLLFCNTIGGILMLCISQRDIDYTKENEIQIYNYNSPQKETAKSVIIQKTNITQYNVKKENSSLDGLNILKNICIYFLPILLLTSLVFSIIPATYLTNSFYPLIISCIMIVMYIVLIIAFASNKNKLNDAAFVMLFAIVLLSIFQIIISLESYYSWAMEIDIRSYYYYNEERTRIAYAWEYWVTFGLAIGIFVFSVLSTIFGLIAEKLTNKKVKNQTNQEKVEKESASDNNLFEQKNLKQISVKTIVKSNVQEELEEVKRLFDSNVITQEEYTQMRSSVIKKYYK